MICLSDQLYALSLLASPFTIIYCAHLTNGRCDLTLFDPGGWQICPHRLSSRKKTLFQTAISRELCD